MKMICRAILNLSLIALITVSFPARAQDAPHERVQLDNPVTAAWLKKNIVRSHPRLILTPARERELMRKLGHDPMLQAYYKYLKQEADRIMTEPFLKRELQGFRLLAVSREMVERMGALCLVYRREKAPEVLRRIDEELRAVCAFEDWNPQHFLDVGEMSFAVAMALDWVGEWLPEATVELAEVSLIEKGIVPSFNEGGTRMFWINSTNNWNAVCHGGMIAASLAIAERDPELAAKTISRALEKLPGSLGEYGPDGVYPEGPTYWGYGTSYTVLAIEMLTTALGSDFGISDSPGFMESANFRLLATAPSGQFFNFADSDGRKGGFGSVLLIWFAAKTGDGIYLDREFLDKPERAGRLAGPGLVWLSMFSPSQTGELHLAWRGRGANPVGIFRGGPEDPGQFYLATKGGGANVSHGNMDAGTFIFELDGIRWVIDPGNQPYYPLNRIGFNLSGRCQDCPRWTLLTKRNTGHSTITVNDARHNAVGHAPIADFQTGDQPSVTFDMSDVLRDQVASGDRTFIKENNRSVLIEDRFVLNDATRSITWGLMTTAEVTPLADGALLEQDGKQLKLRILAPEEVKVSVISLDPPPLVIDKTIENLKRIELRIPAWIFPGKEGQIRVRLSGEEG